MSRAIPVGGRVIARNSVLNLVGLAIPLIVAVAVLPVTIRGLGTDRFAILALAWIVTSYLAFLDLGLGRATARAAASAIGRGEESAVAPAVWTALTAQLGIGLAGSLLLVGVAPLLVQRVLRVPPGLEREAISVFYLLAAGLIPMLVTASLRGVLEAAQRFDLVNVLRAPASVSTSLIPFVGVLAGWSLPGIVLAMVGAQVVFAVGHFLVAARLFPALRRPRFERTRLREMLTFGWWITVPGLVIPVFAYLDRVALGSLVSLAAVTYYAAPSDMLARLWIIPASLVSTLFPALSQLEGAGQEERIVPLVTRSFKYVLLAMGPFFVLIAVNAPAILDVWLGPAFTANASTALRVLALGTLANFLSSIPYTALQGMGRADLVARVTLLQAVPYVLLLWWLVSSAGVVGAAVAWTVRNVVNATALLMLTSRVAGISRRHFVREGLLRGATVVAVYGLAVAFLGLLIDDPWLRAVATSASLPFLGWWLWRRTFQGLEREGLTALFRPARAG